MWIQHRRIPRPSLQRVASPAACARPASQLPPHAGDELADLIMSRYEKASTLITSNREIEDWAKLMGDAVIVTPLLDRLMHHGHLLKFVGKSWRLKESADRLAKGRQTA
jgi:hypothetical protein